MRIDVLDVGYVELIEYWGTEERIIEAARMSTGGKFRGWDKEEKLLAYLWNNRHTSPFEMAGAIIEVKAPIAVFREWHRHRTQSYNEMSARYTPIPNDNYVPTVDRLMESSSTNKQAGTNTDHILTIEEAMLWQESLMLAYDVAEKTYRDGLALGIPKELARLVMPVGRYSTMRAQANLLNWLRFLGLRSDKNQGAMKEIRVYGEAVAAILEPRFQRVIALWRENSI